MIDGQKLRGVARARPAVKSELAAAVPGPGDDQVCPLMKSNVANAEAAQVQLNGGCEFCRFPLDDIIGVQQRDEQGFSLRNRVAKANQEMPLGRGRKTFDVQSVPLLGGAPRGFGEVKLVKFRIAD